MGECITVWLGSLKRGHDRVQVEMRVLYDGTREIYIEPDAPVKLLGYKDWDEYGIATLRKKHAWAEESIEQRLRESSLEVERLLTQIGSLHKEISAVKDKLRTLVLGLIRGTIEIDDIELAAETVGIGPWHVKLPQLVITGEGVEDE